MHTLVKALVENKSINQELASLAGQYGSYKLIRQFLSTKGIDCRKLDASHKDWLKDLVDHFKLSEVSEDELASMLSSIK